MKKNRIVKYLAGAWQEIKKVKWPTKAMVFNHTAVVIVASGIAILVTAGIDYGLTYLIEYIVNAKG